MSTGKLTSALALAAIGLLPVSAFADPVAKIAYDSVREHLPYAPLGSNDAYFKNETMCEYVGVQFSMVEKERISNSSYEYQTSPQDAYEIIRSNELRRINGFRGTLAAEEITHIPESLDKRIVNLVYFDKRLSNAKPYDFYEFGDYCIKSNAEWAKHHKHHWHPVR